MAEEDLIFGKKRHLFGGIEPSNMVKFEAIDEGDYIKIKAIPPTDTVVDGQTLCDVAGTIIRRKNNDFPKDEFDGEFVVDIKNEVDFLDTHAITGNTYFYSAFPYTSQDVYNRNKVNRTIVNGMDAIVSFSHKYYYDNNGKGRIEFDIKLPVNATGAIVCKSESGYPDSELDGEQILDVKSSGKYVDENIIPGKTYMYSIFPYDAKSVYYRGEKGRIFAKTQKRNYFFGFDLTETNSNPNNRVVYPSDVDNYNFTPAKMNYNTGKFNYGGWNLNAGEKFMPRPCMLNYDGTVAYYLDPNNYAKKVDGSVSDVNKLAFKGNAMMEWPKIFVKRTNQNGIYKFRCSDVPVDDTWDCLSNYDKDDNQIDYFYTAIYIGTLNSGKMRSISGLSPSNNYDATQEINYSKSNGKDWYTEVLVDRLLINDLLIMIAKSTNCQSVYGNGRTSSSSASSGGSLDDKGLFWGSSNSTSSVKVFGMEEWWGNINRRIAGWIYAYDVQKVKLTRGTHDGSSVNEYNTTGDGYINVSGSSISGSNYIKKMLVKPFGRLPLVLNGSSTTYEADSVYYSSSNIYYAYVGGSWNNGAAAGPFFAYLNDTASSAHSGIGVALSCKPLAAA